MWKREYSKVYPGVSKEAAWRVLTDVNGWAKWHGDLESCRMDGPFQVGNYFMLQPKGMKPIKITLTEVNEGVSFTDCTPFFGARMYDTHHIEESDQGVRFTNTVVVEGPLKWVWVLLVAKNVAASMPEQLEALIKRIG